MYNRYIPNGTNYTRVTVPDPPSGERETQAPVSDPSPHQEAVHPNETASPPPRSGPQRGRGKDPLTSLLGSFGGGKEKNPLSGIWEKLKLDDIDNGDILLILILLFLFRDGDDLELVIALGLLLLLGLGDLDKKSAPSQPS